MIVCICRGVSDRAVRLAISDGSTSVDAVASATGAGTGCGVCREEVHEMLADQGHGCGSGCADCPRRRLAASRACATLAPP